MTPYGRIYNESKVYSDKNHSKLECIGYVKSDDNRTIREVSRGLPDSIRHGNKIAYEYHKKFKIDGSR